MVAHKLWFQRWGPRPLRSLEKLDTLQKKKNQKQLNSVSWISDSEECTRPLWSRLLCLDLIIQPTGRNASRSSHCFIVAKLKLFLERVHWNKMWSNGGSWLKDGLHIWGCVAWKYQTNLEVHLAMRGWIWHFPVTFATVSPSNISQTLFTWTSASRTHTGRPHTVCQSVHDTHRHTNTQTNGAGNLAL